MDFSFDIFQIYSQFCAITSGEIVHSGDGCSLDNQLQRVSFSKEALSQMLKVVETRFLKRVSVLDELCKLKSKLECLKADFSEFSRFYDFVFFLCRENGQKSITVSRAITAWRLVLTGSFRLLNEWCDFVEKNQKHNISEDTWRQILAFSRCVNENLEGYDPQGAWPVLIDDFVDYMYRTRAYCGNRTLVCGYADSESQPCHDQTPELTNFSVPKRKFEEDSLTSPSDESNASAKRRKLYANVECTILIRNPAIEEDDFQKIRHSSSPTMCAIEDCLSRGFSGILSGSS